MIKPKSKDMNDSTAPKGASTTEPAAKTSEKVPAAVASGRTGGVDGGGTIGEALSNKERSLLAKKAALAKWNRKAR